MELYNRMEHHIRTAKPADRADFTIGCFIGLAIGFTIAWMFGI